MAKAKFSSYKLRKWSILVRWRDRTCRVCGTRSSLQAHHINDKSYHPTLAYNIGNGVTLCRKHHTLYHTKFRGSFRMKCTLSDFKRFLKIVDSILEVEGTIV